MQTTQSDLATMLTLGEHQIPEAIFISSEALEAYLSQVRAHREDRRRTRALRIFLEMAKNRIQEELNTDSVEEEQDILAELQAVLSEIERRLNLLTAREPYVNLSLLPTTGTTPALLSILEITDTQADREMPVGSQQPDVHLIPVEEPLPSEDALKMCADILLPAIEDLEARWNDLNRVGLLQPGERLNRMACFQTRALACQLGALYSEANRQGVLPYVADAITAIRDSMELACAYANDAGECVPFEVAFCEDPEEWLLPEGWNLLAERYEQVAEAHPVWEWYLANQTSLTAATQQTLLNAIVARQQALYRLLEQYGGRDYLQAELYGGLRNAANSTGYLIALCSDTSDADLDTYGNRMCDLWRLAQHEATLKREVIAREERKSTAIQAVLDWSTQHAGRPVTEYTREKDRSELFRLLEACIQAEVPPTNVPIRTVLLELAPLLLNNAPRYSKFLEAVLSERKRKGLDKEQEKPAVEEEPEIEISETQMAQYTEYVSLFTANQKILILGGTPRQNVREELKSQLECEDVKWPESKRGDKAGKFQADIKRANILILVKNFASHEMTEKGREWIRANGGHFVLLPGGYGVKQIIHQLYLYVTRTENSRVGNATLEIPTDDTLTHFGL